MEMDGVIEPMEMMHLLQDSPKSTYKWSPTVSSSLISPLPHRSRELTEQKPLPWKPGVLTWTMFLRTSGFMMKRPIRSSFTSQASNFSPVYAGLEVDFVFVLSCNLFVCLFVFSGFKKEQLKVHIGSSGKLLVSGERPLIKDQWSRFSKEFQLPEHCNADKVHGKLENGLLTIVLPKLHHRGGAAKGADAGKEEKEKGGVKRREGDAQRGTRTADAAAGNQVSRTASAEALSDEKMKLKSTLSMDVPLHPHEGRLLVVGLLVAVVVVAWYLYQKLNPAETQRHGASPAI